MTVDGLAHFREAFRRMPYACAEEHLAVCASTVLAKVRTITFGRSVAVVRCDHGRVVGYEWLSDPAAMCKRCRGSWHVCEEHPDRPWGGLCCDAAVNGEPAADGRCEHGACACGAAGEPCAACGPA